MLVDIKTILAAILICNASSAHACDCKKASRGIELPGPPIGSEFKCEEIDSFDEDNCSFNIHGITLGVTSGIVAWKEISGAELWNVRLPLGAKPTDNFRTFVARHQASGARPSVFTGQRDGLFQVSTDLCMVSQTRDHYELFFEFDSHKLIRVVERIDIL